MSTNSLEAPRERQAPVRHLLTYDEIAPLTRGRNGRPLDVRTLQRLQWSAKAIREQGGEGARLAMPAPVDSRPNPSSANLPDQPLFDGLQIREWLENTDRLAPFLRHEAPT